MVLWSCGCLPVVKIRIWMARIDTLRCLPISSYYFFREYQKATKGSKAKQLQEVLRRQLAAPGHTGLLFPDTQHLAVFKTSKRPKWLACRTSSCRHVAHAPFPVHHFSISLYGCASSICRPALRKHPLIPHWSRKVALDKYMLGINDFFRQKRLTLLGTIS
jgi:hypothetical protein